MIDVFISRPTWVSTEFSEGLEGFLSFLSTMEFTPRTIGATDYPTECPLDEVIKLLDECQGIIVLGYPQIILKKGFIKNKPTNNLQLPTEWNHIEASLAYSKGLPILVIHHKGVRRGIFEHGAINKYIYEKDLSKVNWFLSQNITGALKSWKQNVIAYQKKQFVKPLSKDISQERPINRPETENFRLVTRCNSLLTRIGESINNEDQYSWSIFVDEYNSLLNQATELIKDKEIHNLPNISHFDATPSLYGQTEGLKLVRNAISRLKEIIESL